MQKVSLTSANGNIQINCRYHYTRRRFLKLPQYHRRNGVITLLSLLVLVAGSSLHFMGFLKITVAKLDFSDFLLDYMLGFLLFAGALHTDVAKLRESRGPIITFATVGILLSTLLIGTVLYLLAGFFDLPISLIHCLLFGALISPTDPIAVLSILKKAGISQSWFDCRRGTLGNPRG